MTIEKLRQAQQLIDEVCEELGGAVAEPTVPSVPMWLATARDEIGVKEVRGAEHNPRILSYLASTTLGRYGRSRDETPWCSAFVNWCMLQHGIEGTGSAMARSWLGWGVELDEPRGGCVVVLARGKAPSGHVGFYEIQRGSFVITVLGGNQSDSVCLKTYRASDVLGYRWPE